MKQIFPNLYRFDGKPRGKTRTVSHSYLFVRKQGNLLICNKYSPVTEYMDEIDALGGIDTQLIARYIDASPGDYHEAERKMTRTRTKCPEIMFGDEGLKIGRDFEVYLFPNKCHTGTCLFRWRNSGKYYLLAPSIARVRGEEWRLRLQPAVVARKASVVRPTAGSRGRLLPSRRNP